MKRITLCMLTLLAISCTKEETNPDITVVGDQKITYKVEGRSQTRKRVIIKLWSVQEQTKQKGNLMQVKDTVLTGNGEITLTHKTRPTIYCYTSLDVQVLDNQLDTLVLSISTDRGLIIRRSYSCAVDNLNLPEMFMDLYNK